jgi:hypothetical protein
VIDPVYDANGVPDISRLTEWLAVCDRCQTRQLLSTVTGPIASPGRRSETEPAQESTAGWLIGATTDYRIYCPPCIEAIAADLIGTATDRVGVLHRLAASIAGVARWVFLTAAAIAHLAVGGRPSAI